MCDTVALDGLALKEDLAIGRLDKPGDHLEGGRLTRAVRAQVAGYLTGPGRKTDILDSRSTGIHFGNVAQYKIAGHYVAFYFIMNLHRNGRQEDVSLKQHESLEGVNMSDLITKAVPVSKKMIWTGRILSAIPILLLLLSAVMKFMKPAAVIEGFARYG